MNEAYHAALFYEAQSAAAIAYVLFATLIGVVIMAAATALVATIESRRSAPEEAIAAPTP